MMIENKKNADKIILDTCVLLEYFLNSKKAEDVEKLLDKIVSGNLEGYISVSTITEITTFFVREDSESRLPEVIDFLKNNLLILNTTPEIAFLAGTAIMFDCIIVTYDSEFDRVSEVKVKRP